MFKNEKATTVMYLILSLIMGLCIFACSIFATLKFTIFSPNFLSDTINSTSYYNDLCAELKDDLVNIGDASGLDKNFFDDFVDEVIVRKDVQYYVNDFYAGEKLKVNPSEFQKALRTAIDKYINRKGLDRKTISDKAINGFIKEATDIYVSDIEITYFPQIQKSYLKYDTRLNILMAVTIAVIIAITLIFIFTNKWKHIAVRYIYYATASAGLLTLLLPIIVFLSGVIGKITIISRSLNDLYTACFNSMFYALIFIAATLVVISAFLWIIHNKMRRGVAN